MKYLLPICLMMLSACGKYKDGVTEFHLSNPDQIEVVCELYPGQEPGTPDHNPKETFTTRESTYVVVKEGLWGSVSMYCHKNEDSSVAITATIYHRGEERSSISSRSFDFCGTQKTNPQWPWCQADTSAWVN